MTKSLIKQTKPHLIIQLFYGSSQLQLIGFKWWPEHFHFIIILHYTGDNKLMGILKHFGTGQKLAPIHTVILFSED